MMAPITALSACFKQHPMVAMIDSRGRRLGQKAELAVETHAAAHPTRRTWAAPVAHLGTSTNLVDYGLLLEAHRHPLRLFEIARVGIPGALVGYHLSW
jgi:hypothetical protein